MRTSEETILPRAEAAARIVTDSSALEAAQTLPARADSPKVAPAGGRPRSGLMLVLTGFHTWPSPELAPSGPDARRSLCRRGSGNDGFRHCPLELGVSVLVRGTPLPSVLAREALGSSTRVSCTRNAGQAGSWHHVRRLSTWSLVQARLWHSSETIQSKPGHEATTAIGASKVSLG